MHRKASVAVSVIKVLQVIKLENLAFSKQQGQKSFQKKQHRLAATLPGQPEIRRDYLGSESSLDLVTQNKSEPAVCVALSF